MAILGIKKTVDFKTNVLYGQINYCIIYSNYDIINMLQDLQ